MGTNEFIGTIIVALGTILSVGATVVKPLLANVKVMTQLNESIKTLTEKFNNCYSFSHFVIIPTLSHTSQELML